MKRTFVVVVLLSSVAGCAHKPASPLPTYHGLDDQAALKVLADRATAVKTLSSQCRLMLTRPDGQSVQLDGAIAMAPPDRLRLRAWKFGQAVFDLTLTRPDGQSVQLDGAIAMAPPDRLRLRAWKFNQAVFDLTLTPDGLWVVAPDDPSRREKVLPASLGAAQFGREWAMLNGGFFLQGDLVTQDSGKWMNVRRRLDDGRTIVCGVDRATLTPRHYEMLDPQGHTRFRFLLDDYRMIDAVPTATWLIARSAQGNIEIRLKDVELNQELAPTAFTPPRRAEKRE